MELLPLFQVIWARRLLLAVGLVAAIALGVTSKGAERSSAAVSWVRVSLDTPTSQLVKSAPAGADTLPWRASLMVHEMTTDEVHRELARRMGLGLEQVVVVDPDLATPQVPASLPTTASDAAAITAAPFVVTVYMPSLYLPLIAIEAAAPDRAGSQRLAAAAVAVMEARSSTSRKSYSSKIVTGGQRRIEQFVVDQVSPVRTKAAGVAELPIRQIGFPIAFFVLWSAAVVLPSLLVRGFRRGAPASV